MITITGYQPGGVVDCSVVGVVLVLVVVVVAVLALLLLALRLLGLALRQRRPVGVQLLPRRVLGAEKMHGATLQLRYSRAMLTRYRHSNLTPKC